MKLSSKSVLLFMVFFISVVLWSTFLIGQKEKKQYQKDQALYEYSVELLSEQDGYRALPILKQLDDKYPKQENILMNIGIAQVFVGDYQSASESFALTMKANPFFQLNPSFIMYYANTLIINNDFEKAKILLNHASERNLSDEYPEQFRELNAYIEQSNNN